VFGFCLKRGVFVHCVWVFFEGIAKKWLRFRRLKAG